MDVYDQNSVALVGSRYRLNVLALGSHRLSGKWHVVLHQWLFLVQLPEQNIHGISKDANVNKRQLIHRVIYFRLLCRLTL